MFSFYMIHHNYKKLAYENLGANKECPVCLQYMNYEDAVFFNCSHTTCFQCANRINKCPICREPTRTAGHNSFLKTSKLLYNRSILLSMQSKLQEMKYTIHSMLSDVERDLIPLINSTYRNNTNLIFFYPNLMSCYINIPEDDEDLTLNTYFSDQKEEVIRESLRWYIVEEKVQTMDAYYHSGLYYTWLFAQKVKDVMKKTKTPFFPPKFKDITCGRCGTKGHSLKKNWCL